MSTTTTTTPHHPVQSRHPMQPLVIDEHNVIRFKKNAIVDFIVSNVPGADLNTLAMMDFSAEDHVQLAQLIGYSVSGFGDLSYVDKETYDAAYDLAVERFPSLANTNEPVLY